MALAPGAGEVHVWSTREDDPLPRVLARYLDREPGEIELQYGEHGKPHLAGRSPALRFNLSHSRGLTLIAVAADREVGVDVERIAPGRDFERLAERWLGDEAVTRLRESADNERAGAFYAAWTRHEAVAKCLGTGLARPLPAAPPASVHELDVGGGHAAALAVASVPNAMLPACQTRPPGKVARLGAGKAPAPLSSAAASSARTSSPR
jgi:phosphopantetheinyl transferase